MGVIYLNFYRIQYNFQGDDVYNIKKRKNNNKKTMG